jgi:hypothetical protein
MFRNFQSEKRRALLQQAQEDCKFVAGIVPMPSAQHKVPCFLVMSYGTGTVPTTLQSS